MARNFLKLAATAALAAMMAASATAQSLIRDAEIEETLREWTRLHSGRWDAFVVVPDRRLGRSVVLTAWRRSMELKRFDAASIAAFIDAYRGRGPELPVR